MVSGTRSPVLLQPSPLREGAVSISVLCQGVQKGGIGGVVGESGEPFLSEAAAAIVSSAALVLHGA